MLQRLGGPCFQPATYRQVSVRSPRLYHFDLPTNTQIMEDIVSSERLRDVARHMSPPKATDVGEALGTWLAGFHRWSLSQVNAELLEMLQSNAMIDEMIHQGLDEKILAYCGSTELRDTAQKQLMLADGKGRGVIYGDLTTKKYESCVPLMTL